MTGSHLVSRSFIATTFTAASLMFLSGSAAQGQDKDTPVLRIGSSGSLFEQGSRQKEMMQTLEGFIKDETGFKNTITPQKDWEELAARMAKGELQLGAFTGYEFAWAREKYPDLKPLALAVNVYTYPTIHVVTKKTNPAKDFAGLKGQSIDVPKIGSSYPQIFVDEQCRARNLKPEAFFFKITTKDSIEDAIDNLVDGKVQAVVAERVALEAYKQGKPGRFKQLKEVAASRPLPPPVIACYGKIVDQATLDRFRQGLLDSNKSDRGQTLLNLYRLTGFVDGPADFDKILADTRKEYPPIKGTKKPEGSGR